MTHHNAPLHPARPLRKVGLTCLLTLAVSAIQPLAAEQHRVAMDKVHWVLKSDRFLCKLELPMKSFGALSFLHPAGHPLELRYTPSYRTPAQVQVAAITPPWVQEVRSQAELMIAAQGSYKLPGASSRSLFDAMGQGLWTLLYLDAKEVLVPTIRWHDLAEPFQRCERQLSPLSINQARDTDLHYRSGQRALSEAQLAEITRLARYIKIDNKINKLLVDSYTDNTGSSTANLQISRERAADVAAVLVDAGVDERLIEQRAHGSRYPSADNSTAEGRDRNRKVTIRVIRHSEAKP